MSGTRLGAGIKLWTIAAVVAAAGIVAVGTTAVAGPSAPKCPTLDGKYVVGEGWTGAPAPGISVVSASDDRVVFNVTLGYTLKDLCVKTGRELNKYGIDPGLPVDGPRTVTLTKSGAGLGLASVSFDTERTPPCGSQVTAPDVSFGSPVYIDRFRAGGEPVSVVAQDGSINVSAHAGTTHVYKNPSALPGVGDFAVGYFNQTLNWRSTDGGEHWQYVGFTGQQVGPHSATSTGFSDPDFAMDQDGNLYNVEIDLGNDSVYKSVDDGQSYPIANPQVAPGDRPWVTALEPNEVFLYINSLPKSMHRSTDPDLLQWEELPVPPVTSKSQPDPQNPDDGLIGPIGLGRFAVSGDDAHTWQQYEFGGAGKRGYLGASTQFFGVLGVDRAGNVYQAAAGGYGDEEDADTAADDPIPDPYPNGEVTFTYYNRSNDPGATNQHKLTIPTPPGDALWPWVIAGDDGRVAVVWYQSLVDPQTGEFDNSQFYIFAAITNNAHGTTVKCADGSTKFVEPKWAVRNVSGRPIHRGQICLQGTNCNAEVNFELGDRRLGDFFTVNYDLDGNVFIASADTLVPNPVGGAKPVANPIFIKQSGGEGLLEEPIEPRDTRPKSDPVVPPSP